MNFPERKNTHIWWFIVCNLRKYFHLREIAGTSGRQIRKFGHLIRGMHFFDTSEKYRERCTVRFSRFTYNSDCKISLRPVIICFSSLRPARIWRINFLFIEHWQPQTMFHLERLKFRCKICDGCIVTVQRQIFRNHFTSLVEKPL